ncbi:MAG: caspase family protein [Spirochaetales bacterium]|nr:caspase family protein [Spirochaetales bacterium]
MRPDNPRTILLPLLILTVLSSCSLGPKLPTGRAYIYGVTDYGGGTPNIDLAYTDDDAEAMAALFDAAGYITNLRINAGDGSSVEPATVAQLQADIDAFIANAMPEELFIFYFAGHGVGSEDNTGDPPADWLILHGFYSGAPWDADHGALSDDGLATMLKTIPGSRKLVILDSCHSGGFIGDSPFWDPVPADSSDESDSFLEIFTETVKAYWGFSATGAEDIASGNAFVLTAAGEVEKSVETAALGHGVFTYAFLLAAEAGDLNQDGFITLKESYRYMTDNWSDIPKTTTFQPHLSGSAVDLVLFSSQ